MTLKERILADLSQHPQGGDVAYLEIYCKISLVCSYEHFRFLLLTEGIWIPATIHILRRRLQTRDANKIPPYEKAFSFIKKRGEFKLIELQNHLTINSPDHCIHDASWQVRKLEQEGKVEKVSRGVYRSLVA